MSEISFDNLCDILKLLPAKSLLRFRCLSKAHCSLIDTRDFINLHLSQSIITNTNRSLITSDSNKFYMIDLDSPTHQVVECENPLINPCFIVGSCNGLIALYHPQGLFMWNPSTKTHQKLPYVWRLGYKNRSCDDSILDGFGYDPVSDDYKWIRIRTMDKGRVIYHKGRIYVKSRTQSSVTVYSVKHNCSRTMGDFPYKPRNPRDCGTLVGSCLHWIVSDPDDSSNQLICFNLEDERFVTLPVPNKFMSRQYYRHMDLGEVRGWLSMSVDEYHDKLVEIWVMKEYGKRDSWVRIYSVYKESINCLYDMHVPSCAKPIGYSKNGDKLLLHVGACRLWECDLQEEENQTSHQTPNVPDNHVRGVGKFSGSQYSCVY